MRNVHSQHEYFQENLKIEREKLNEMKQNIFGIKEAARTNLFETGQDCYKCWSSLLRLDYDSIYSYIELNNKPVKKSYDDTLSPLQRLLIGIYFLNTCSMSTIYIQPFRLFFFTTFLAIVNICIYAEVFIDDRPNVYYTLTIGICIFLFSIYLLFKIVVQLLMIIHYQSMKKILRSK